MESRLVRRWRDRGAAAVEFALVVPILILFIFGSIEFGLAVNARTQVANAAREGVRLASLNYSVVDVQTAAKQALTGISGTPVVTVTCANAAGVSCVIGSAAAPGNIATVTVTLPYTGVTGMFPQLTNTTITGSSYMRIEQK